VPVSEDRPELPLGERLDWKAATPPVRTTLRGSYVLLRPVDAARDAQPLYAVSHPPDGDPAIWTYLPDGPYESADHLRQALAWAETTEDRIYFTLVRLRDERPLGVASYLRITPELGTIEIGHIWFGGSLQRTSAATDAIYLLARHAFDDLGYRRLEWKCNALNAASRRGIATALLRHGEQRLHARGAVRLTAIVADDDPTAIDFWETAGYTRQNNRARFVRHLGSTAR
jgi:RimJ/RimL family protein N-acetyltransferase